MYVAVTSSHPLKVYIYNDIVLRFCPANYVDPVVEPEVRSCYDSVLGLGFYLGFFWGTKPPAMLTPSLSLSTKLPQGRAN